MRGEGAAARSLLSPLLLLPQNLFLAKHGDNVIGRDDACELVVLVYHRQRQQVVLIEEFGDAILALRDRHLDEGFCGEAGKQLGALVQVSTVR